MAKRADNQQTMKQVVRDLLKIYGLEDKYMEVEVKTAWEELMGKAIAKKTRSIRLRKKVLTIQLDSGVLKEEFSYAKEKIAKLINDKVGQVVIEKVEIY